MGVAPTPPPPALAPPSNEKLVCRGGAVASSAGSGNAGDVGDVSVTHTASENTICGCFCGTRWLRCTDVYHAFEDVFREDILAAGLENHVLVAGKDKRAKELEEAVGEVDVHDGVGSVEVRKRALYTPCGTACTAWVRTRRPAAAGASCTLKTSRKLCAGCDDDAGMRSRTGFCGWMRA